MSSRHRKALKVRLEFLKTKDGVISFYRQEIDALEWAIPILEQTRGDRKLFAMEGMFRYYSILANIRDFPNGIPTE